MTLIISFLCFLKLVGPAPEFHHDKDSMFYKRSGLQKIDINWNYVEEFNAQKNN